MSDDDEEEFGIGDASFEGMKPKKKKEVPAYRDGGWYGSDLYGDSYYKNRTTSGGWKSGWAASPSSRIQTKISMLQSLSVKFTRGGIDEDAMKEEALQTIFDSIEILMEAADLKFSEDELYDEDGVLLGSPEDVVRKNFVSELMPPHIETEEEEEYNYGF